MYIFFFFTCVDTSVPEGDRLLRTGFADGAAAPTSLHDVDVGPLRGAGSEPQVKKYISWCSFSMMV